MSHSYDDVQAVLPTLFDENDNSSTIVETTANDLSIKVLVLGKISRSC